ncbi:MAG: hypothetical protein P8X87_07360 [Candidatus Bathyarchaeota archaeon]
MKLDIAVLGVLVFAIGGTILFWSSSSMLKDILQNVNYYDWNIGPTYVLGGFIGFLLLGAGLFAIGLSAKTDK